ncbi:MAG: VWA domain-containing protein [Anaerolinea sp.]|nr:VWA domain-containing protein [Anaerolinea sp.]
MSFASPWWLVFLAVIPVALGAYFAVQHRRSKYAVRFTNLDLLANVVDASPGWRRHLPPVLSLLALALLVLAIARPETTTKVPKEEATVVLVTDVSGSMNATDVEPTRLAAAQESARILLDKLPKKVQVSLISFSSSVTVLVQPTTDREEVKLALDRLRPRGGTAMGDALQTALEVVRPPEAPAPVTNGGTGAAPPAPTPRAVADAAGGDTGVVPAFIILLSDGAQTLGNIQPLDAADAAKELDVPIFAIALGTQNGVAQVEDNQGRTRTVRVPPDEETLTEIAEITGGKFFSAPTKDDLDTIYKDLGSKIGYTEEQREVTWAFAGLGALLVAVSGGLSLLWFNRFP